VRRTLLPALCAALLSSLTAGVAIAQPDDWGNVKRDPFDKGVIAKYKGILARSPHDGTALTKLVSMYRKHRTLELLHDEYEEALKKKPDDHALLVVAGRIAKEMGDEPAALAKFEAAAKAKKDDAPLHVEIGTLYRNAGKKDEARAAFALALDHADKDDIKLKALRALADLALATNDVDGAKKYFEQNIKLKPKDPQLRTELGDALLVAGRFDDAIASYREAEKLLGGDPQKKMEIIARIGQTMKEKGDATGAIAEYRRAIKIAPKGYFLENELTTRIVEIYREKGTIPELLAEFEKAWPENKRGFFEWDTLAGLYENVGRNDESVAAYRKAIAKNPYELEIHRKLITLLQNLGKDEEALKQNEQVVKYAPGEGRFRLELAERYWRKPDPKRALDTLKKLESHFSGEPGMLSAIADLYIRWNKEDLALDLYVRLHKLEPNDAGHLETLGEQYYMRGDKTKAMETWKKIADAKTASAEAELGRVLNDHGMPAEALLHYAKAIKMEPNNPEHYKGDAKVREGQKQYQEAVADWEKVLSLTPADQRSKRREAQRNLVHIITRWGARENEYKAKWQRDFKKSPPDIEAGYFLVEYFTKKPGTENEPRNTLVKLHELVPTDQETLLDLVKAYRGARKYDEAVALLLDLAKLAPTREREAFTQISEIKGEQKCKDCAKESIEWQLKAQAKSPNDPDGFQKLAERYRELGQLPEAIAAYEKTIALDARKWKAHFELAQLYIDVQEPTKASQLYRKVLRNGNDDDEIEKAAKKAIDLDENIGQLGELEKVLSSTSMLMSHKPIYRRKLIDLYQRYVLQQVRREKSDDADIRAAARAELNRLGSHGLKPLLEALHDDKDVQQQRVAVYVLGHIGNKGAAAPLVQLAKTEPKPDPVAGGPRKIGTLTQSPEMQVRVDALVAAGRLGDPSVTDQVLSLAKHEEVAMREAAVFTIGRGGDKRAIAPLIAALDDSRDSVQAMACLGLAVIDDAKAVTAMTSTVGDVRRHDLVRAACAYGLGLRRAKSAKTILTAALTDNHGETQRLAGWALGQIGDADSIGVLLRAYFARRDDQRAELAWAIARTAGTSPSPTSLASAASYPTKGGKGPEASGKLDLTQKIEHLPGAVPTVTLPASVIAAHVDDIVAGVTEALTEHRDIVLGALTDLDARGDGVGLAGLVGDGPVDDKTRSALAKVGAGIATKVAEHTGDTDPKVRALAVSVLAKVDAKGVDEVIVKALGDKTLHVREAALRAVVVVGRARPAAVTKLSPAVAKLLADSDEWQDRKAAATTLAALGGAELATLTKAASDSWAFVREAVATALGASGQAGAVDPLLALSKDSIAPVRAAAARALGKVPGEAAKKRRTELAGDSDPTVKAAAAQ
jgi:tetratricopeptide (TPR) repeat protein